ncbi:hypothetical protein VOLCADRAFT_90654 [Volvox carteri f. nagariensis]|uniref:C-type lectin domain-containing protein n=1 Tax=Volvox carteri f. nagariensis TaxID=3068 RepID=D8TUZ4_VOLCA|nr:uncharacterized protein VOLCADRAFT_90654 [Volvox carteri f. nagariensis]EFJ48798.1 hypothetical protein VOLCADRAFT_90654 [Volvox carteri f. nagariensis]|eukprot:XP_002950130.1 hypothetical protein VOLCADRAFT_90654 [Volvox carteri f. nagariensis]
MERPPPQNPLTPALIFQSPNPPPPSPPPPSVSSVFNFTFGNSSYSVYNGSRTFGQAEMFCNTNGGSLLSVLSAEENAAVGQSLKNINVYGIIGNGGGGTVTLWMGLRINQTSKRYWTDGNDLTYLPPLFNGGIDVFADGGCYSLRCAPGSDCIWSLAVPPTLGCVNVTRDGFICKIDNNRYKGVYYLTRAGQPLGTVYALVRPPSPVSWRQADDNCKTMNGRLVSINTADEYWLLINSTSNLVLRNQFPPSDLDNFGNVRAWIGLQFITSLENSFWVDGTRADRGYNPQGIVLTHYYACYAIYCRIGFCDWQSTWCGDLLPAYICELRNEWSRR